MPPTHAVSRVVDLIDEAHRVFVLSGAGISTESGVPDFRGPHGLWTRDPQAARMFDLTVYRNDPDLRSKAWRMRMASEIRTAQPNAGHHSLAAWQTPDRQVTVATQNIDGLHQRGGSTTVLELHGSYWESMCLTCDERRPVEETFRRVLTGEPDPRCLACGGILKTGTVAFGQSLPATTWSAAVAAAESADVVLAIGSTLTVQPAASLCDVAVAAGAPLVVINAEPTGYDERASVVIHDRIGPTLHRITAALGP